MDRFRWCYIGCGKIASKTAMDIERGNHCITAVYGRNASKAKEFAEKHNAVYYENFESAVTAEDVDGVYIATPHTSHAEYAVRALKLNKPVLCEKPVGVSRDEVETIINAAKENNTYFCEAMWTWFSDVALTVRDWINSGKIGDVLEINVNYAFPGLLLSKDSRVRSPETAGGALLDIGIYPITYCYYLLGYPESIECKGKIQDGIDVSETVTLYYEKAKCTLRTSFSTLKESCVIKGTEGEIRLPFFHMANEAKLKNAEGITRFKGKTDYLTEFSRASEEIKAGKKESGYVPFEGTLDCISIMDECRKQMKLVYPFEK